MAAHPAYSRPHDGESLLPRCQQSSTPKRTALHWHMPAYTTNHGRTPCAVIREGDWEIIHWSGGHLFSGRRRELEPRREK